MACSAMTSQSSLWPGLAKGIMPTPATWTLVMWRSGCSWQEGGGGRDRLGLGDAAGERKDLSGLDVELGPGGGSLGREPDPQGVDRVRQGLGRRLAEQGVRAA